MTTHNKVNILAALALTASFFLPWVVWNNATITGLSMPTGDFFATAKEQFGVENPFPQFSYAFNIFWLIPVAAIAAILFCITKKDAFWPSVIAGLLSVSLALVYFLFSKNLVDQLGTSATVWGHIKPWIFVHLSAAIVLIFSGGKQRWILETIFLVATAVATIVGFNMASGHAQQKILDETFGSTDKEKAAYTFSSAALIKEFLANDTASNKKYKEKIVEVSGNIAAVEIAADSVGTIRFEDSTGSFASFTLEKNQFPNIQSLKAGDAVVIKGVCSGSIFSEILNNTQISFKRSVISKK